LYFNLTAGKEESSYWPSSSEIIPGSSKRSKRNEYW